MRDKISRAVVLLGIVAFGILWYIDPTYSADETANLLWKSMLTRVLGSVVFFALPFFLHFHIWNKPPRRFWTVLFPCLLVVLNNIPYLALINGDARVERFDILPLFVAESLFIGIFEELAFRGTLFIAILEKHRANGKQIFLTTLISSALFGLVHLANLLEGAGVGATLMQVGYSFLIGGMCSIVLLKTGNLLFCILLHDIFDFGGNLIDHLGSGAIWNVPTVVITAVLAVLVAVWLLYVLFKVRTEETNKFYDGK